MPLVQGEDMLLLWSIIKINVCVFSPLWKCSNVVMTFLPATVVFVDYELLNHLV